MGEHLVADLERIRTTASELRYLHDEFSGLDATVDGHRAAVGSQVLFGRLDDFVENWKIHRKWLMESLDVVAKAAQAGVDAYKGVDDELTKALLKNMPDSGSGT